MKHIKTNLKDSLFKKFVTLFLALFILFSVFICTTLAETGAETESTNLIQNGGFDDTETLKTDWGLELGNFVEEGSTGFCVTDEMKDSYEGSDYALKFSSVENNNVYHLKKKLTTSDGIVPGATYELSYRIYANLEDRKNTGIVGCELDFYNGSEKDIGAHIFGTEILYTESTTNNRWAKISGTFVFPSDATMLRILLRNRALGTVYFDDISLKMVGAEIFEYSTSHVFHYTTEEHGTAEVSILPYYQSGVNKLDEEAYFVNFGIYDAEEYVTGLNEVPFTDFRASYTYSVENLKVLKKKYTLRISVIKENEEIDSYEQSLYKYERPKFLDEDGNFRNKWGEIVKPFNAWHMTEENLDEAADAGFTTFTMSRECRKPENEISTVSLLTTAENEGLIGLFTLYSEGAKPAGHADNLANTEAIVKKYVNDKRFLGWVVQDEPFGGGITGEKKELLEHSYKFIRDLDPNHPIILTDYNKGVFKETLKYCDIFIPNSYGKGYDGVRAYVEEAVKHAHGRPVYPNICAYSLESIEDLPSGQQVRHFIHQAFLAGAKGVSVYSFNNAVTIEEKGGTTRIPIYDTPLWEPLIETGNNDVPLLFDLFVYGKETPEEQETADYVQRKWTRADGDYYFLMSTSDTGATVEYDIGDGKEVKLLGGENVSDFTFADGKLSVTLKANTLKDGKTQCYDVQMFKVVETDFIRVEKNGVGIRKMEIGEVQISVPEETETLVTCLYETADDGKSELIRVETAEGNSMSFVIDETEVKYSLKIYAWDTNLKPIISALTIPHN